MSRPRAENVAVLLVLPEGLRIVMDYVDDGTTRDITALAADLICEYLVRAPKTDAQAPEKQAEEEHPRAATPPDEEYAESIGTLRLTGGSRHGIRFALVDTATAGVEELPAQRLLPLLGDAVAMTIADALAHDGEALQPDS